MNSKKLAILFLLFFIAPTVAHPEHIDAPQISQDDRGVYVTFEDFELTFLAGTPHFLIAAKMDAIMLMFTELREISANNTIVSLLNLETLNFQHTQPSLTKDTLSQATIFRMINYVNTTFNGNPISIEIPISIASTTMQSVMHSGEYTTPAKSLNFELRILGLNTSGYSFELQMRIHQSMTHMQDSANTVLRTTVKDNTTIFTATSNLITADLVLDHYSLNDNKLQQVIIEDNQSTFGFATLQFTPINNSLAYAGYVAITVTSIVNAFSPLPIIMMVGMAIVITVVTISIYIVFFKKK